MFKVGDKIQNTNNDGHVYTVLFIGKTRTLVSYIDKGYYDELTIKNHSLQYYKIFREKKKGWINIWKATYKNNRPKPGATIFNSKEEAMAVNSFNRLDCIEIEYFPE